MALVLLEANDDMADVILNSLKDALELLEVILIFEILFNNNKMSFSGGGGLKMSCQEVIFVAINSFSLSKQIFRCQKEMLVAKKRC